MDKEDWERRSFSVSSPNSSFDPMKSTKDSMNKVHSIEKLVNLDRLRTLALAYVAWTNCKIFR